jgi:hypothetical protein
MLSRKSAKIKRVRDQDGNVGTVRASKHEEKKLWIAEEKLTRRTNTLAETTRTVGVYLESGQKLSIEDARRTTENAEAVIQRSIAAII